MEIVEESKPNIPAENNQKRAGNGRPVSGLIQKRLTKTRSSLMRKSINQKASKLELRPVSAFQRLYQAPKEIKQVTSCKNSQNYQSRKKNRSTAGLPTASSIAKMTIFSANRTKTRSNSGG